MLLMSATVLIKFPTVKLDQVRSGHCSFFMLTGSSGLIMTLYSKMQIPYFRVVSITPASTMVGQAGFSGE